MKVREGFVSNSSTTSFVIIGNRVKQEDINFDDGEYVGVGWSDWMEGTDVFNLTPEHLQILPFVVFDGNFWKVVADGGEGISKAHIPEGDYEIEAGEATQHSSYNATDLLENYEVDVEAIIDAVIDDQVVHPALMEKITPKKQRVLDMYQQGQITLEAFQDLMND